MPNLTTPSGHHISEVVSTLRPHIETLLAHKCVAQVLREKVDAIYADILKEIPVYNTFEAHGRRTTGFGDRIFDHNHLYLCQNEALLSRIFAEADRRERAAGLKPDDMGDEFCPACVAEHKQTKAEWALIDAAEPFFGIGKGHHSLVLDTRKEYLNLLIGLVVNYNGEG